MRRTRGGFDEGYGSVLGWRYQRTLNVPGKPVGGSGPRGTTAVEGVPCAQAWLHLGTGGGAYQIVDLWTDRLRRTDRAYTQLCPMGERA